MAIPAGFPVTVDVDGYDLELGGEADPSEVIEALAGGDWWAVLLLLDAERHLWGRISDHADRFSVVQANRLLKQVVQVATGYPWFTSCLLAAHAAADWQGFDGLCAYRGFDPWSEPVPRTLAIVHHLLRSACDTPGEHARLEFELAGPEEQSERGRAQERAIGAEWAAWFNPDGTAKRG